MSARTPAALVRPPPRTDLVGMPARSPAPPALPAPDRLRTALAYTALWVPLLGIYVAVLQVAGFGPLPSALGGALRNVVPAAVFGTGVWWLSGRLPWPDRRYAAFAAVHAAAALAFSAAWAAAVWAQAIPRDGWEGALAWIRPILQWQLLSGFWLYGIVAGVSYAVRGSRHARERQRELERAEAARVQAELAALRAHLNPHFLFNTLHSLTGLVRSDPGRVEAALEQFGDLFRYVLRLDRQRTVRVTLEEEWAFVRTYLSLEAMRLGARLRVDERLDPETLDCRIPPLLLQPLVENAVRHGASAMRRGGTVTVESFLDDHDTMTLTVTDDGPGADPARVAAAEGLGLRAARQRVEALGGRARVEVHTAPGEGFRVRVVLPAAARRSVP